MSAVMRTLRRCPFGRQGGACGGRTAHECQSLGICTLKKQVRMAHDEFYELLDSRDCGAALLKETCPAAADAARRFNEGMAKLEEVDALIPEGVRGTRI